MLISVYILAVLLLFSQQQEDYKQKRESMVKNQIERRGVNDQSVLKAMGTVRRHHFVPVNQMASAYEDHPLPIGYGQTISQPYIVAYMTWVIKPQANFKVLEIGSGSGYQAAVLAEIVKEVYTIEIVPQLADSASQRLKRLGYKNVQVKKADGYEGWKEHAPYDAIVVTAAAEYIPPPLLEQLKDGGKMVIPIGSPFMTQQLMLVEKNGKKRTTQSLMPVVFVPFTRK